MSLPISRRSLVAAALSALPLVLTKPREARAAGSPHEGGKGGSSVVGVTKDRLGTTVVMHLEHAPFPAAGYPYRDPTVLAFIPHHFRVGRDGRVGIVAHFHGHNTTVPRTIVAHQLREQLYDSKQNAILLVPEIAVMARDSAAGKLETQGAFASLIDDAIRTLKRHEVRAALGSRALPADAVPGRICVSAHSGGYHPAACVLRAGGAPIHEVYLFDALYGDLDVFRDWVIAGRGKPMSSRHKLISYFTAGTTETNTKKLFVELAQAGVVVATEHVEGTLSREELTHAEAVSIRTRLAHGRVTSELNGLRDCLYASALKRRLRTSWFDAKTGARPLERRRPR